MKKEILIVILIFVFGIAISCVSKLSKPVLAETNSEEMIQPTRAELVMKALAQAYSDQIEQLEYQNDDWTILMRGTWYYFSNGRLLPEDQLENAENYRPMQFYNYPKELPEWQERSPENSQRFRNRSQSGTQNTTSRSAFFVENLWQTTDRAEAEKQQVSLTFLGKSIRMHKSVEEKMKIIEELILSAAETDPEVKTWIDSLAPMQSWNWRNIANSVARSNHSYGIAIDLLPQSLGGQQTYWLWAARDRDDWWNVPYTERYHPPVVAIKAFEDNGFIWGGKWGLFDTMHFEYRPEILILNGF